MKKIFWIIIFQMLLSATIPVAAQTPLLPRDTSIKGPQTFAMVLGISKYKYVRPLNYADKDAELFRDFLRSPAGGSVKEDNIFCLLNEKVLNANFFVKGFQWLKEKQLQKGDKLFIYLAGHGDAIDEDQFFFLGYDCNPAGDKNNYLVGGAMQLFNLKKKIFNETAKGVDVFFIMDACRSNELPGGQEGQNFLNTAVSEKQAGEVIMLATAAGEESLEDASIGTGHGLFTYYLVDGLNGMADSKNNPDNKITFKEIEDYVDKNVPSVAQQRFKRKQDPFFCCTENNSRVISMVDTAYLSKWLKTQKNLHRGPGNSFNGDLSKNISFSQADTSLIETYNLFNKAISDNNLTGKASAEYYYQQMDKKYRGNPYTLDAKSTLAVEYINDAQKKVNRYLECGDNASAKEKQENFDAAFRLEKAINIVKGDDPDFANSYISRMFFLMSSGDYGKDGKNGDISIAFQKAHAALAIDHDKAYILNKLAQLHLQNNQPDSAVYYAEKATRIAPKWTCAFATLALAQKALSSNKPDEPIKKKISNKPHFGILVGAGANSIHPAFRDNANTNITDASSNGTIGLNFGIICQAPIGKNIDIRPAVKVDLDGGDVVFDRRPTTGGTVQETIQVKNVSINIALPFIIRFAPKKITPFFSLGPSFSYIIKQDALAEQNLPLKKSILLGDAGLGLDINIPKAGIILSPEIKYTKGFSNIREDASTAYSQSVSSLKKQGFMFNLYLRKR